MADFLEHYDLVEKDGQGLLSFEEAQTLSEGNLSRVWFVREGDEEDPEDPIWSVEPFNWQFVNCMGYYVSTEPRRPEHDNTIFTY